MANFAHILLDNQIYFVTTSTRARRKVFCDPQNVEVLLGILKELRETEAAKIYAFVVMPDHLHLLLKPEKEPLPRIVQMLKGKSARLINAREKRSGALWQKEYYERALRSERDLREAYEYIAYNPVKSGLYERREDYPYSSEHSKELVDTP